MNDKYEMISAVIVALDNLADARGAEKCRLILEGVQRLAALKEGLKKEDQAHQAELKLLQDQLADLTRPPETDGDTETIGGRTYHIGVEGGGANVQRDAE